MEEGKKSFKGWLEKNTILALICALALGLILGIVIMYFCNCGNKVAKVNGKSITVNSLFDKMKNNLSMNLFLENIDGAILNNKYKLEKEELDDIKKTAQSYIDMYTSYYGYTEEDFLNQNGFESFDDFVEYLSLDYKRTVYYYDTLEKQLDKNAVKDYYNENAFGKINTKHILVKETDEITKEKALEIANEIISKVESGEDFDKLSNDYKEKYPEAVVAEDLGEMGAFDHLDEAYVEAMKELNKGDHTTTPVETSFGYHVILCVDKTEKSEKISRKDRMSIVEILSTEITDKDADLFTKTLIQMRKDAKLKIYDKDLKDKYDEWCKQYIDEAEENKTTETELEENVTEMNIDLSTNTEE